MKDSLIYSCIKSFCIMIAKMAGFALGLIPLMIVIGAVFGSSDKLDISSNYSPKLVANANDVRKPLSKDTPTILKLNITGFIGMERLSMETVRDQLTESREGLLKNDRVKALLVHINTGGGTVVDSDGIYRAIKEYKERHGVPVYAYIDGLCASGGMYVASSADKIFASDISLVGSIGVVTPPIFNFVGLMEKVGVKSVTLSAGKEKDALNPFRPWKEGEEASFKSIINAYYDHFVDVVIENRPAVDKTKLIDEYGAKLFPAQKAAEIGYIDGADHNLNDVLELLSLEMGVENDQYQVVEMEGKLLTKLFVKGQTPFITGKIEHTFGNIPELKPELRGQFLYYYYPEQELK